MGYAGFRSEVATTFPPGPFIPIAPVCAADPLTHFSGNASAYTTASGRAADPAELSIYSGEKAALLEQTDNSCRSLAASDVKGLLVDCLVERDDVMTHSH